jgi:hypothetical protein
VQPLQKKEKVMKSKYLIIGIILLLIGNTAFTQVFEQSKILARTFPVNNQSTLKISNKYGNVMFTTWNKDSVGLTVNIKVSDRREVDAVSRLATIDVKFTPTPYYIDVVTVFNSKNNLGADIADKIASGIFNAGPNVTVDYVVNVPEWLSLEIENKYGSVYMADHKGNLKLDLSNGDFKAGSISGESNIIVDFGNITLNSIKSGRMDIGYSELVLKKAGILHISGRSSKCWITTAESLDLDSKRDKFYIDTLRTLSGQCSFSFLQIALLDQSGLLRSNFGDVRINGTSNTLTGINLNSEYTDVVIHLPQALTFSLFADYKKTVFTLPPSATAMQSQLLDEKTQQYRVTGTAGPGAATPANLLLNAVGGSITLITP